MDKPEKDGEKESIEEILSDLNSLLNRMPAIISDINMPEITPVDFSRIRREASAPDMPSPAPDMPPPAQNMQPPAQDARTPAPDIQPPAFEEPLPQDAAIPPAADETEGITASAVPAYGESEDPGPEPVPDPGPYPDDGEYNFDFELEERSGIPAAEAVLAAAPEEPVHAETKPPDPLDQSGDFGVPDIDALLQLSASGTDAAGPVPDQKDRGGEMDEKRQDDQEKPAEETPGSVPDAEPVVELSTAEETQPAPEQPAAELSAEGSPAFEATVKMDAPSDLQEPAAEQPSEQVPALEATVKMDAPFEFQEPALEIPAAESQAPVQEETLPSGDDLKAFESAFVITGTDDAAGAEAPSAEAPAELPAAEVPSPLSPELEFPAPEAAAEPGPAVPDAAAPETDARPGGISLEPQLSVEEPAPAAGEEPPQGAVEPQLSVGVPEPQSGGLSLEPRSDTPFESPIEAVTASAPAPEASEERTVVFGPGQMPETPGGGETLVYQGGDPTATSRMKAAASLPELAAMEPPGTVDESRIKTMAFLYASGEEKLCADVLATLDSICLKSESRPMFIKRAFVKPCADDMKGELAQQLVAESGAAGVFCVGAVSQEALYDIENSFNSAGLFFRHFSSDSFGLSSALDSVLDLILRP